MSEDPQVTRPRQEWAVSFGVGAVFAGCLVAAVVFMVLTLALMLTAPEGALPIDVPDGSTFRVALLIGGLVAIVLLAVGPSAAYAVAWMLRNVRSQAVHVIAFAVAGVVVGAVLGLRIGGPGAANLLAAMLGVSAAGGRAAVTPFARR